MSHRLSYDDATGVIDVLITTQPGYQPKMRVVMMRGALDDVVSRWPQTDWAAVVSWLRRADADQIADWLDEAVRRRVGGGA